MKHEVHLSKIFSPSVSDGSETYRFRVSMIVACLSLEAGRALRLTSAPRLVGEL